MARIVSFTASGTEILVSLGFENELVGRSHACDHPEFVKALPPCCEPNFSTQGSSFQIEDRAQDLMRRGRGLFSVHADTLKALAPDLIVAQSQGDGWAVGSADVEGALGDQVRGATRLVSLAAHCLDDVWDSVRCLAAALGVPERGEMLVDELKQRMGRIEEKANSLGRRPTVVGIAWIDPLTIGGDWMPDLVRMAGGKSLFADGGKRTTPITWEKLLAADPEVIIAYPNGFDVARARGEMHARTWVPCWHSLKAVREQQVYVLDGRWCLNRPGPRLVESLEILAEILHPESFSFGHQGTGWERF